MTHPLDEILLQAAVSPHGLCLTTTDPLRLFRSLWNRRTAHKGVEPYSSLTITHSPTHPECDVWIKRKDPAP